jgi:beta-lactamase class A
MYEGWRARTLRALAILVGLSLGAAVVRPSPTRPTEVDPLTPLAARAVVPASSAVHKPRVVDLTIAPSEFDQLEADIVALARGSGARVAVTLTELSGRNRHTFSYAGDQSFKAASLYKLPVLMAEAQSIAEGASPSRRICFQSQDYEQGWYDDYDGGQCYSMTQLGYRIGKFSDNTAAHMLVRHLGGVQGLNAFAVSAGAVRSRFFDPNTTTADDLAALWKAEATGNLGGAAAQAWLYPLLSHSQFESGIPAGSPGASVLHKIGAVERTEGDAALVSVPGSKYVLVVLVSGISELQGWPLIARIAHRVWTYETAAGEAALAATPAVVASAAAPSHALRGR